MIELPCDHCASPLRVEDTAAGARVVCSHCKGIVVVPPIAPAGDQFSGLGVAPSPGHARLAQAQRRSAGPRLGWKWVALALACGLAAGFVGHVLGNIMWLDLLHNEPADGLRWFEILCGTVLGGAVALAVVVFGRGAAAEKAAEGRREDHNPFA